MSVNFTVMTWNVENLFRPGNRSGSGPRDMDVYARKLTNIGRTIAGISPDVIAFQEVGEEDALRDLLARLGDRYPYMRVSRHPDVRGIRVALVSRLPLLQARDLDAFPPEGMVNLNSTDGKPVTSMGRGALKATVVLSPGLLVNVVTAHLKSKLITYPGGRRAPESEDERARETGIALLRRAAEAVAVRVWMNRLMVGNNEPAILLGDFNDEPDAVTTQLMLGPEDRSLTQRDKFDDIRLYSLANYIPAERRYSRIYHKSKELIDHIMVSHELIFYLRKADSFVEPIEGIDQDVDSRRDAVYPDHAPIFARFEIPEDEAERHFSITRPQ